MISRRYRIVTVIITLIWMLSMVSCMMTKDQLGQKPDEFVKVKGNVKTERVLLSNKI